MKILKTLVLFIALPANVSAQVSFTPSQRNLIEKRLTLATTKNSERQIELKALFQEAGCGDKLVEQQVSGAGLQNVICTLPGETGEVIVVGAHFDQAEIGKGIVDNW